MVPKVIIPVPLAPKNPLTPWWLTVPVTPSQYCVVVSPPCHALLVRFV